MLVQRPTVRRAMRNLVLLYSLLAAMYVLAISLAGSISSLGPTGFGSLLAMSGLGMAIGAVLTAQVGHRISRHHLGAAGLATITCCLVMLGQLQGRLLITLSLCTACSASAPPWWRSQPRRHCRRTRRNGNGAECSVCRTT